jgi:hypothetical protein
MAVKALGSAFVLAFAALPARSAFADEATPFRLSWVRGEGAGSCPDARSIAARAAERLSRNPFSETAKQSIEGSVAREGDELAAVLRLRDDAGVEHGRREIRSRQIDCVELGEAVVLAVVLTIDPNAAHADAPALPAPTAPPPAPPAATEPPALGVCPVARCPTPPACPPARCPVPPPLANVALAARFVAGVGILPSLSPGGAAVGEVGGARVRGSFGVVYFPEVTTSDERYAFGLTTGFLGAIFAWPLASGIELAGTAELEAGAVHAVVFESVPVDPGEQWWVAGALGPRLGFLGLSPLRVELGVSLVVPFSRPSFKVRGITEPVFKSAPIGGFAYAGLGFGLP